MPRAPKVWRGGKQQHQQRITKIHIFQPKEFLSRIGSQCVHDFIFNTYQTWHLQLFCRYTYYDQLHLYNNSYDIQVF